MNEQHKQPFGQRVRRIRITQGLTMKTVCASARIDYQTLRNWEQGVHSPQPWRLPDLAQALDVPLAQLFTDELVLAEVRVSDATLERCRQEGRQAAQEAAQRIAAALEPAIWQAATQPPVDTSPGARAAKKRRTRTQVLAGSHPASRAARGARPGGRIESGH